VLQIQTSIQATLQRWLLKQRQAISLALTLLVGIGIWLSGALPALAGLTDDHFDGNIYALYAGNGSLVPPRVTLADALRRHKPALLVFYVDDSSDCKQYASVVNRVQEFYGRAADLLPIDVDMLPQGAAFSPQEPGYYYQGLLPQTVLINQQGEVVLNKTGQIPYEQIDDAFRQVFDLLPRSESVQLKRRAVNEINTELAK